MSLELLCGWLGLPVDAWPPHHYALLGLTPGEADQERIQHAVQERLQRLRRYQLTYPEEATEGLNRLALAFDCLTNAATKQAYDAQFVPAPPPVRNDVPIAKPIAPPPNQATPSEPHAADWSSSPPPERADWTNGPPEPRRPVSAPSTAAWYPPPPRRAPETARMRMEDRPSEETSDSPSGPVPDELLSALNASSVEEDWAGAGTRGLGSMGALLRRVTRTRELLLAWEQLGRWLAQPERRLTKRGDAADMERHLETLLDLLEAYPPLLGQAGQPGYSVIALARQPDVVAAFASLQGTQREILARHWQDGRTHLLAYRRFLRSRVRDLQRTSRWVRLSRWLRMLILEHPLWWLLPLAFLTLNIASISIRRAWPVQLVIAVSLLVLLAVLRGPLASKAWLERSSRPFD